MIRTLHKGLEDEFGDIVGKARRGQELSDEAVSRAVGLTQREWASIERYEWIPEANIVEQIADVLRLSPKKLIGSAQGAFTRSLQWVNRSRMRALK